MITAEINTDIEFKDNQINIGNFRILISRSSGITVLMKDELVDQKIWNGDFVFGVLEQAVKYCTSNRSPSSATHYKKTMKSDYRYYKKDDADNWLIYVNYRHPMGWQPVTRFEDLDQFKPLK